MKAILVLFLSILPMPSLADTFTSHCRDFSPHLFFENGKCIGILPDLVTDIFKDMGHEIQWVKVPWIRSLSNARQGSVDLLIRHSMTPEREDFLHAIPYAHDNRRLSFYKSRKFKADITSYEDLKSVNIGYIRGHFYSPTFSTLDMSRNTPISKTEQLVAMLEFGRIDVAVTSSSHSISLFEGRFDKATFVDDFFNPLFISIPKKSKAANLHDKVSSIMLKYRQSGRINQYFEKYGLAGPETKGSDPSVY